MSAVLHSEQTNRLRQVGLTALNGAMAIVCGLLAVMVAALAAGVLAISLSTATGWPRGGYDLSSGLGAAHVDPGAVKVMTGSDTCTVAAGRRTCKHVTYTRTRPAPAGVTAERLVFAVAFIAILTPLVALSFGLGHAAACFTALARRRWFERRTITHLRNFALGGLVFLALWPVATPPGARDRRLRTDSAHARGHGEGRLQPRPGSDPDAPDGGLRHPAGADHRRVGARAQGRRRPRADRLMPVRVTLNVVMAERNVRSKEHAAHVGISEAKLTLLKQGKVTGRAVRDAGEDLRLPAPAAGRPPAHRAGLGRALTALSRR